MDKFSSILDLFHAPGLNSRDLPLKATNLKDKPNQEPLNIIIRKFTFLSDIDCNPGS